MVWGKKPSKEEGRLSGPKAIPEPVLNYLVAEKNGPQFGEAAQGC
jgi:hypothetical protein